MIALISLWPLAAIVVVLAMCVWMLWPDRTPEEPAPYHAEKKRLP